MKETFVVVKIMVFWVVMPCSLVDRNLLPASSVYPDDGGHRFL